MDLASCPPRTRIAAKLRGVKERVACHQGAAGARLRRAVVPLTALIAAAATLGVEAVAAGEPVSKATDPAVVLETTGFRLAIGRDGRASSLIERRTKDEILDAGSPAFVDLVRGGRSVPATACSRDGDLLTFSFEEPGTQVVLRTTVKPAWVNFEIVSAVTADGATPDEVGFGILRLALPGKVSPISGIAFGDRVAATARPLNLATQLRLDGGPRPLLRPFAAARSGIPGARFALAVAPREGLRAVLRELLREEKLPWSPLGGPFALEAEENRGSYVFATVSEANADEWIALARTAGLAQIHLIGWEESLGHYEPRKDLFPRGLAGLRDVVARIHAAGLRAGMHTLTGGISRNDRFVSPVPDPRLAKDGRFMLAADIGAEDSTIPTAEPPGNLETSWQYSGRSNVIQIGRELVQYTGLSQSPPYGLTGCARGAFGTAASAHSRGDAVDHLFAIYGTFQPDETSDLVDAVADRIALAFNECRFDMIYQDGAEGMPGGPYGWARMREAVFRRLQGRVLVEASEWGNLSWPYHSRIGAYDHPNWGLKRFVDIHCRDSQEYQASSLLAAQLGWWAILGPNDDHPAELPDELEYLCVKSLANDLAMSFQGIDVGGRPWNARQDEYLEMIGRYERLRLRRAVPAEVLSRLAVPREEFRLAVSADGSWRFTPVDIIEHKVTGTDDGSAAWTVTNRHGPQPLRVRVETLYSAAPHDAADAVTLASFEDAGELVPAGSATDVSCSWSPAKDDARGGGSSARYTAASRRSTPEGTWAAIRKSFAPELDISRHGALGVWVRGDAKGEILNFQLSNPDRFWPTWDEHYVDVDFEGWRYFELHLRERDADRFIDHEWPYAWPIPVFRSPLIRTNLSALTIYYNRLPPGGEVDCRIGPVKALPVARVRLEEPTIEAGAGKVVFPVTIESGRSIEMEETCVLRDERGAVISTVSPQGKAPRLEAGENQIVFRCKGPEGYRTRARVTIFVLGEPFGGRP